jgi:hypothetical protein
VSATIMDVLGANGSWTWTTCGRKSRITARILSWQLAKFIHASAATPKPGSAILATTHDDLAEDLSPDVTIYKGLAEAIEMR